VRILQLVPRLPFPADDGGKIGILGITRAFIALGHEVRMSGFDEEGRAHEFAAELAAQLAGWYAESIPKARVLRAQAMVALGAGTYLHDKYFSESFARRVIEDYEAWSPDLVHVDHSHLGSYGLRVLERWPRARVCIRAHNVESVIWYRRAEVAADPLRRAIFRRQGDLSAHYEKTLFDRFSGVVAISEVDSALIRRQSPQARIHEMPAGYDLQRETVLRNDLGGAPRLCFVGSLDYTANRDGLEWFAAEVWPAVRRRFPAATLTVAGRSMRPVRFLESLPGVRYLGFVDSVSEVTDVSDIAVVPLRVGGGMRLKILDFLSRGLPVVSTTIGAEGIPTRWSGRNVMRTADTADEFVSVIDALAGSAETRYSLARTGRALVAERYEWRPLVSQYCDWAISQA